ncbi:rhomboid family intramembrane serine protease [Polaribacter sp. R77954]|uniref:rhomboid family intramembrane serine protease n=1 Tax=Polaribacter sp. R77954 TaxID=3093870 RepID=UPI0037C7803A
MLDGSNPIVLLIIVANVLFSMKGFDDYAFLDKFKFQINRVKGGEKIRMLSSGFLHVDWMHLILNMYVLYAFGNIITNILGVSALLIIYFGSLLAGSFYTLHNHKNEPYYSAVGASGAVSGIVYSSILLFPGMQLYLFFAIPIPGYIFAVGYLLYSIYGMKKQLGNIGHAAHLGGAIGGFVLTLVLNPVLIKTNSIFVIALAIPIALLLFFGDKLKRF